MPAYKKTPSGMTECSGPGCAGCSSANCYGHGGRVKRHGPPPADEAGVHEPIGKYQTGKSGGTSIAGEHLRLGNVSGAKHMHRQNLEDLQQMNTKKPELYAEGGSVESRTKREDNERGVHGEVSQGRSTSGINARNAKNDPEHRRGDLHGAKLGHRMVLNEMRDMKKPNLYAEGGEVADGEPEMDEELKHAMGGEFMDAMDRKDRKGIMSALEAIVLSCRGKE